MASTEYAKSEAPPSPPSKSSANCFVGDVALRVLLFAASLVAVVVMVTSKQTKLVPVPGAPGVEVPLVAKFNHSPAFIYFVAALSVACLYSIITTLASLSVILKPTCSKKFLLFFAIFDALIFGIVASAAGAAAAVAYIGLKGNDHVQWNKVCNRYNKFCIRIGSSVAMSLVAAIVLFFLIKLSVYSLYKRIRD